MASGGWVERWVWIRERVDTVGGVVARRVWVKRVVWVVRAWRVARWVGGGGGDVRSWVVQFVRRVV